MTENVVENRHAKRQARLDLMRKSSYFEKTLKHSLATTRFNNSTWNENCKMREKNESVKCIYASPIQISSRISLDRNVFVLEMNNDENKIMGIGLIKNHPVVGKYSVYSMNNYNRFIYIRKWRIGREDMDANELEVLRLFEAVCFKGTNHSKRGQGITGLPTTIQYKSHILGFNMIDYLCDMFKKRMNSQK